MTREGSATAGWALHTKRVNIVIPALSRKKYVRKLALHTKRVTIVIPGAAGRPQPGIQAAGFKRPTAGFEASAGMTMVNSAFFSANATHRSAGFKRLTAKDSNLSRTDTRD
jgi:hypothetical protein